VNFEEEKEITDAKIVMNHFGYWPSFHDAEVISIKFERPWDTSNSSATLTVYAFEATDELDDENFFQLIKHCCIEIEFIGMTMNSMDGFNHQNVVGGLNFGREGKYLFCKIDSTFGVDGYIEAKEIKIKRLDPLKQ